jgi:methylase of polypeptide subunit release factors
MIQRVESWEPTDDTAAAAVLGRALARVGYDEDAVCDLLGDDAFETSESHIPVHERRLPQTPQATAVRLGFLGRSTARGDAEAALGVDGAAAYAAAGLATFGPNGDLVPRGRILPVEDLLLASDGYSQGAADPADYVATFTPTARRCSLITPRRHVRRALDVGTGSGAQALLAARHADEVVATDLNPRALAFTRTNAALSGVRNVETREGSLFEPVAGEVFDLIVCNAPFVVSPESRFIFRDGALPADEFSERVVAGAVAHLADGGFATLLVSWVADDEDEPDVRPFRWVDGTGCDAWILGFAGSDPLDHAAGWNDYLEEDPDRFAAALDEWTAYLTGLGVGWITEGAVLLHRRTGSVHVIRADDVDEDLLEAAGGQIERVFASYGRVAEAGIVGQRLRLAPDARLEHELDRRGRVETRIRLVDGMGFERALSADEARLLASLDGTPFGGAKHEELLEELLDVGFLEIV